MRGKLHCAGLILATVGAGVGIVTANTALAANVAPGCAVAIAAGVALCVATHRAGVHGPSAGPTDRQGW